MEYRVWSFKKLILILVLYTLYSILYSKPVFAEQKQVSILRISPIILNISLSPGKIYQYEVTLENLLNIPLPLKAELDRFDSSDEEGGYNFTNNNDSPLVSWTSIDPQEFIILPQSKKTTNVTIKIPDKIPVGGYYAMIFFQPVFPNLQNYPTQIQAKIGLPILANIGVAPSKGPRGEILNFSFDKFLYEKGPINLILRVKNTSLYHFSAKPFLILKPFLGKEEKQEIEEKIILPGKTRRWNNSIAFNKIGLYQATMAVSTGSGDQILQNSYFIYFPLIKTVILITCIAFILFIISKRKRFKKAFASLIDRS